MSGHRTRVPFVPFLIVGTTMLPAVRAQEPEPASSRAHPHAHAPGEGAFSVPVDVGFGLSFAAGGSSARGETLRELQGGAHDPRRRGFNLQQAVVALGAALDERLYAHVHASASIDAETGEGEIELEEAYALATLSGGLEAKVGTFFTGFGRANALHPHQWDWLEQPFVHTRLFGPEGMRGPGVQVRWQATPGASLAAALQNADGETMVSFLGSEEAYEEQAIGGRAFTPREVHGASDLLASLRAAATVAAGGEARLTFGVSGAFGPNATGDGARTCLYGADVGLLVPGAAGALVPRLAVELEYTARAFEAAEQVDASDPLAPVALPARTLDDHGGHAHVLLGLGDRWAAGVRAEVATGSGASYRGGGVFARSDDPFRCDRVRVSPLLVWRPASTTRVRLEYSYDDSDHLGSEQHSVWLGFDVWFGAHGRHAD